jgi:hypothetical protein
MALLSSMEVLEYVHTQGKPAYHVLVDRWAIARR